LNFSQEVCAVAKDLIPPCTPTLSIDADCPKGYVTIKWNNVRNICSDDVLSYVLFYKSLVADKYTKGDTIANTNFSRTIDDTLLIPGCYAIQSVDSSGNASVLSPDFCIDNCPEFELPNIFSPNDDKVNDFYKAIKVRRIKEINLVIFDRWGNLVYKTSDPYFQWDGTSLQTKNIVSEGTFFYFCDVFESRLTGIRTRTIKGYLQMVR
jgi:gliding motility-associated-like protein